MSAWQTRTYQRWVQILKWDNELQTKKKQNKNKTKKTKTKTSKQTKKPYMYMYMRIPDESFYQGSS